MAEQNEFDFRNVESELKTEVDLYFPPEKAVVVKGVLHSLCALGSRMRLQKELLLEHMTFAAAFPCAESEQEDCECITCRARFHLSE